MPNPQGLLDKVFSIIGPRTRFFQPGLTTCGRQYPPKTLRFVSAITSRTLPKDLPTISIVIPALNQAPYLDSAIRSVLEQGYPRTELVVADGGSTDGSKRILEKYSDQLTWWCCEQDSGQTSALNKGFSHTTGEIMAWLNADDLLLPGSLARIATFMDADKSVEAAYSHRICVDELGREIGRWILPPHDNRILKWSDFVPQETLFWRRALWEKVGGKLDESFDFAMDWELLLRFRKVGANIVRLPCFLGLFRIHSKQKTIADMEEVGQKEMAELRKQSLGFSPAKHQITFGTLDYLLKARLLELMWRGGLVRYD